ncbi:hypothetical protein E2C01_042983 [Portunus trituberculatus]|uniref:Uncharacterized protein n=1 Tax=Portunus trituberculatus TaxID=210409 RepID=A0A5B7FW99_PORTR|nr:hypothetical protein [Portunus trituberculatus]
MEGNQSWTPGSAKYCTSTTNRENYNVDPARSAATLAKSTRGSMNEVKHIVSVSMSTNHTQ